MILVAVVSFSIALCTSVGAKIAFNLSVFYNNVNAENNLTFSDTLVALQMMRSQFPSVEKVWALVPNCEQQVKACSLASMYGLCESLMIYWM